MARPASIKMRTEQIGILGVAAPIQRIATEPQFAPLHEDAVRGAVWSESIGPPAPNRFQVPCSEHLVCGSSPFRHEASKRRDFASNTKLAGNAIGGDW